MTLNPSELDSDWSPNTFDDLAYRSLIEDLGILFCHYTGTRMLSKKVDVSYQE